jgi:hypothetical protein
MFRPFLRNRRAALAVGAATCLALAGVELTTATAAQAATQGPCDIYAGGGTACVAAHSTTRALYAAYNGSLYRSAEPRTTPLAISVSSAQAASQTPRRRTRSALARPA